MKIQWVPKLDQDTTNPVYGPPPVLIRCSECGAEDLVLLPADTEEIRHCCGGIADIIPKEKP